MIHKSICVLAAALALAVGPAFAQQSTTSVIGTVQDASGAAIPGATVTVRNTETSQTRSAISDALGNYSALSLAVGQYEIRAEKQGFAPLVRTGITLLVGEQAVVKP
jgi:hypothetical protein